MAKVPHTKSIEYTGNIQLKYTCRSTKNETGKKFYNARQIRIIVFWLRLRPISQLNDVCNYCYFSSSSPFFSPDWPRLKVFFFLIRTGLLTVFEWIFVRDCPIQYGYLQKKLYSIMWAVRMKKKIINSRNK